MTTLNELVASIHSSLHSYTGTQEQITWLTAGVDASTTSFPVNDTEAVMRGIAEVDDELIYVHTSATNTLTLAPFGRGFRGSVAAAHATNAMIVFDPAFPRVRIIEAINQCIEGLFPVLFQVKTTDLTSVATDVSYVLPADCEQVLSVTVKYPGDPSDYWAPLTGWSFDTTNTSGNVLNTSVGLPGSTIRVTYAAKFSPLTSTFALAGLSESYADVILYCVAARMIRFLEPARLQTKAVENISRAQVTQAGDAGRMANQLYAMYQTRVAEERKRLLTTFPSQPNFLPR